jgi:hypothetical protein
MPAASISVMEFYPAEFFPWLLPIVKIFFLSPALVVLSQMFRAQTEPRPIPSVVWVMRSLTIWIAFIIPALAAVYLPDTVIALLT